MYMYMLITLHVYIQYDFVHLLRRGTLELSCIGIELEVIGQLCRCWLLFCKVNVSRTKIDSDESMVSRLNSSIAYALIIKQGMSIRTSATVIMRSFFYDVTYYDVTYYDVSIWKHASGPVQPITEAKEHAGTADKYRRVPLITKGIP